MRLVVAILSGNLEEARELVASRINEIFEEKLDHIKLRIVAEDHDPDLFLPENLSATRNVQKMGRTKLVRLRIRKGKVQRRKKFSTVSGYTIRGGRMVRMTPSERLHRRRGARKAKIKIKTKHNQIMRKRNLSLRKRRTMGLR